MRTSSASRIVPILLGWILQFTPAVSFFPATKLTRTYVISEPAVPTFLFSEQPNSSEGLVTQENAKNQLFSAFNNLELSDQYDAVLTGLCAKILDSDVDDQQVSVQDCEQLLTEMNQKNIDASPRSLMALVDVSFRGERTGPIPTLIWGLTSCTFAYRLQSKVRMPRPWGP